jgi:hypothetical protein
MRNTLDLSDEEYLAYVDAMSDIWKDEVKTNSLRFHVAKDEVIEECR